MKHTDIMARKKEKNDKDDYEGDDEGFVSLNLSMDAKRSIIAVFLFVLALLFTLGFFGAAGILGEKLVGIVGKIFGWGKYLSPLALVAVGIILLRKQATAFILTTKLFGVVILFISVLALLHLIPFEVDQFAQIAKAGEGGGYIGYGLAALFSGLTGKVGGMIILIALSIVGGIIGFNISLVGLGDRVPDMKKVKKPEMDMNINFFKKKKVEEDDLDDEDEDEYEDEDNTGTEDADEEYTDEDEDEDDLDTDGFDDEDTEDTYEEELPPKESTASKAEKILGNRKQKERAQNINADDVEWELPPLRLLSRSSKKAEGGDVKASAQIIEETFGDFGIEMTLEDIVTGPTVTQFSFRPASGVRLNKITALSADLALALAKHPIRIEAPIPGKSLVGIEVPNQTSAKVAIRDIINTDDFEQSDKSLLLALGEDVNGDYVIENLEKMPHLLVAGATGAGKSVTINSILLSLLYKNSPDDLKMILVDPKRVELSLYNGIPHLLSDVITDNAKVINAMKWAVTEMERRYKVLQQVGVRDLASYKARRDSGETMTYTDPDSGESVEDELENLPHIVIVIDEMADLMGSRGKEVEGVIARLAQMSRAVGIHLILSTQRPSVEVITGVIKANLPTRIALRVATNIDSRTIIDTPGAEKLVGNGDMLYKGADSSSPRRLQGVYVSEAEVKKVIDFIKRQAKSIGAYDIDEDFDSSDSEAGREAALSQGITTVDFDNVATTGSSIGDDRTDQDPMYEEAKKIVIEAKKASTSYIQRRLRVGYSRAARLVDELEDNGIISPADGSKPRTILVSKSSADEGSHDEPMEEQAQRDEWKV